MTTVALDTETGGKDNHHHCCLFFVTTCDEEEQQRWWEWPVDPLTRAPFIPEEEAEQIKEVIAGADVLVGQNIKYDAGVLKIALDIDWPWEKTECTLTAGHLLASNQKHDLTALAMDYLGVDIKPFEDALEDAVKACRRLVQQQRLRAARGGAKGPLVDWRIAEEGMAEMPSAKNAAGKKAAEGSGTWRADYWLPRAMAEAQGLPMPDDNCEHEWITAAGPSKCRCVHCHGHNWWTVLRDYSNADSAATIKVWQAMEEQLHRRGLWAIYRERMRVIPICSQMELRGITYSRPHACELAERYEADIEAAKERCLSIASSRNYELELPKGGTNGSLSRFVFDVLRLPPIKHGEKSGAPSLDKETLAHWIATLDGEEQEFVRSLSTIREKGTALTYLAGYERYAMPVEAEEAGWCVLHPWVNPTGSDTLRFSFSNPNSANIKKGEVQDGASLRYCFGPMPGREWWSVDAKNIELRIPAYESGEAELIALFERESEPPYYGSQHLLNFSVVYADIWERELREVGLDKVGPHCKKKYTTTWYQYVKNGDFKLQYGGADADSAFRRKGATALLKSRFDKLEALNQKYIRQANQMGYVETIPDRRVDPTKGYPLAIGRGGYGGVKPTLPLNYHTQSTAMWWTQMAMINCEAQLAEWRRKGFDGWIALQVHDELVFDLPAGGDPRNDLCPTRKDGMKLFRTTNLWRVRRLQEIMAQGGERIGVPTPTGCEYHSKTWGEGVTV